MSDSTLALMEGIINRLKGFAALTALVPAGKILTKVPQQTTFPYVKVIISSEDNSAKDYEGMSHKIRVQTFSRESSAKQALLLRAAVIDALEREEINITVTGFQLVRLDKATLIDIIEDEDGEGWQGIVEFDAVVQ